MDLQVGDVYTDVNDKKRSFVINTISNSPSGELYEVRERCGDGSFFNHFLSKDEVEHHINSGSWKKPELVEATDKYRINRREGKQQIRAMDVLRSCGVSETEVKDENNEPCKWHDLYGVPVGAGVVVGCRKCDYSETMTYDEAQRDYRVKEIL